MSSRHKASDAVAPLEKPISSSTSRGSRRPSRVAKSASGQRGRPATRGRGKKKDRGERKRFPLRISAPHRTVVVAEVVASVIIGVLVWRGVQWPWLVATGAVILLVALLTFKDASLPHWVVIWWRWWRGRNAKPWTDLPDIVGVRNT